MAQLFSLGHKRPFWLWHSCLAKGFGGSVLQIVSLGLQALSLLVEIFSKKTADDLPDFIMSSTFLWPNKSPEPTAVGAVSSAVAVHVAGRRWLSFFR